MSISESNSKKPGGENQCSASMPSRLNVNENASIMQLQKAVPSVAGKCVRLARTYKFECCEQWHLADLSPVCALLYPFAYKLTKGTTNEFYPAALVLADYFNYSASRIRDGLKELIDLGFFEQTRAKKFRTNKYRVLSHKEWAMNHPGQCASKGNTPHDPKDPLGRELWAMTGRSVKFQQSQIDNLRNLQSEDSIIKERFAEFWEKTGDTLDVQEVSPHFYKFMENTAHGVQI
jgi:hypothetical protein